MSASEAGRPGGIWRNARIGDRLNWFGWSALAFPVAVLSHELGHYFFYRIFGFANPGIHFGSAGSPADDRFWQLMRAGETVKAAALIPPWQAGAAAAAGIVVTYVTVMACILVARKRPHPFVLALGLIAPLRFLGSAITLGVMLLGKHPHSGSDEAHVAAVFPLPEALLHVLGIAALVAAWWILPRLVPKENHRARVASLIAGIVVGGAIYLAMIGPWLLP